MPRKTTGATAPKTTTRKTTAQGDKPKAAPKTTAAKPRGKVVAPKADEATKVATAKAEATAAKETALDAKRRLSEERKTPAGALREIRELRTGLDQMIADAESSATSEAFRELSRQAGRIYDRAYGAWKALEQAASQ